MEQSSKLTDDSRENARLQQQILQLQQQLDQVNCIVSNVHDAPETISDIFVLYSRLNDTFYFCYECHCLYMSNFFYLLFPLLVFALQLLWLLIVAKNVKKST